MKEIIIIGKGKISSQVVFFSLALMIDLSLEKD